MPATLVQDISVQTVGDIKALLSVLPDDMDARDVSGELLCFRICSEDDRTFLEVE